MLEFLFSGSCVNGVFDAKNPCQNPINVTVYYGNYTDYVRAKKGLPPLTDEEREAMANVDEDDEN